jgi:hypothetical protein
MAEDQRKLEGAPLDREAPSLVEDDQSIFHDLRASEQA